MQLTSRAILILILATAVTFGQKILTLNDAINIALQRNTTLQKSENNLQTAEKAAETAYGQLLPSVGASGSWNWNRTESKGGGSVSVNGGNIAVLTNESRYYSAGISSNWTLFDGLSNLSTLRSSVNSLESAKLTLVNLKQQIVFQTLSYYYELMNDQALLKVKEDNLIWNKKNLETITERNTLGAVTIADVYKQQVLTGTAELDLVQAKNTFETAKSNLLYYLGLDVLEPYEFQDPLKTSAAIDDNFSKDYADINDLVAKALKNRSDYQSMKLDLQNTYENIKQAQAGHLPTLSNSMSFGLGANNLSSLWDTKKYSIGLSLNIPIFSGWSVENRVQSAKVASLNKEIDVTDLERSIKKDIQKNYLDLQAAEKQIEVGKKTVVSAEESRKIISEKYSLGSGTLLDVLSANTDFTTAQTNLVNSQFTYAKLKAQIQYLIGVLDQKKID